MTAPALTTRHRTTQVALTNKFFGQEYDADHLTLEHNSACVVLDSTSERTARFLAAYACQSMSPGNAP